MVKLLIIADDFTGALDTGVKFAAAGASVRVITDYEYDFQKTEASVQVLVMDAETRHISAEEAYQRVYSVTLRAKQFGIAFIYKKTDSALRGNIGSELAAALAGTGKQILHFFPAFPNMGRTTKHGIHYIDAVPVHESVFGKDPFEPVVCSDISSVIALQSETATQIVADKTIVTEVSRPTIVVYDAETDEDMKHLAQALRESGELGLLAGCAGMAETLPELLDLKGKKPEPPKLEASFLVVCGSVNPITRKQLDYAERHGFHRIRLTPQQKLDSGYFKTEAGKEILKQWLETCKRFPLCIIDTNDCSDSSDTIGYAREQGISLEQLRVQIAETIGYLVKELINHGLERTMLITGGDSLLGFMNQLPVYEMIPICEVEPGTVLSQFEIQGTVYGVISKSGGFGNENLLTELGEKILGGKQIC